MPTRRHSDLECHCLGVIWKRGPMSVYSLRKAFLQCPGQQWSGSAGAMYPLVQRLERQELIAAATIAHGRRKSTEYAITRKGLAVLREWVSPPFSPDVVAMSLDPLRSRMLYLDVIDEPQRRAWFERAQLALTVAEEQIIAWAAENQDAFSRLYAEHGRQEIKLRAELLREAGRSVSLVGE
jgi:DNA-binding PadR family transcriptional regulator